jgi:Mrp family chromosome partitioning ATPase
MDIELVTDGLSPVHVAPVWATPAEPWNLVMLGERQDRAAAALRVIRHRLEQRRSEGMWTFGVTSAREGEGKSTFALQLGFVLCESQRARVLVIEANFGRPSLASILGFQVPKGFGFSGQILRKMRGSIEPWQICALGPSLHVLPESPTERTYPEVLHSPQFQNVIGFLARGYDYVIVDGPSVLGSGDANVMEDAVDGIVMVARSQHSTGSDLREAVRQLGDRKTLGVVLWDLDETPPTSHRRA